MGLADGLFNQTVTSISSITRNTYGDPAASLLYSNTKCRWQGKIGVVFSKTTEERSYQVEMWVASSCQIDVDYQVEKDSEKYIVVGVLPAVSLEGTLDHKKVFLA